MIENSVELVVKIGSMALLNKDGKDVDYLVFEQLSRSLRPGMVLVSSGATEIGRLDFIKRNEFELPFCEDSKTDYSSQGQTILMQYYRKYISEKYSVRQLLVEHQHFNDEQKREHIKQFLLRSVQQNAIPIINYNDPVSFEENRKMEIMSLLKNQKHAVECVDNDETASQIACLLKSKMLLIFTGVDGIYQNPNDPSTLIQEISGDTIEETIKKIEEIQTVCCGSSRKGANGAKAKLEYVKEPIKNGTTVYIARAKNSISDVLNGNVKCTKIYVKP